MRRFPFGKINPEQAVGKDRHRVLQNVVRYPGISLTDAGVLISNNDVWKLCLRIAAKYSSMYIAGTASGRSGKPDMLKKAFTRSPARHVNLLSPAHHTLSTFNSLNMAHSHSQFALSMIHN
jgi:hypothetical protein